MHLTMNNNKPANLNFTTQCSNAPDVMFSGTGENGKPRVAIGKAGYTLRQFEALKKNPDIEVVGMASTEDSFQKLLDDTKPDVVIAGSVFESIHDLPPLAVVQRYIHGLKGQSEIKTPGIVVQSVFTPDKVKEILAESLDSSCGNEPLDTRGFAYFEGSPQYQSQALADVIKSVDPQPVKAS